MHTFHSNTHCIGREEVLTILNRAMFYSHGHTIILTGHGPIKTKSSGQGQTPNQLIFWDMWKCEYTLEGQAEVLHLNILNGNVVAVSDGSFQLGNGATAWTIKGLTAKHHIKGAGQTPGSANDQSVYRSELFGLWGIFYSLKWLMDDYGIKQGHLLVVCNRILALQKAKAKVILEQQEKHYDLISAIQNLQCMIPLTLHFHHMKGHQDQGQTTVLSSKAWMNIEMDKVAKQKVSTDLLTDQSSSIPHEGWLCFLEGKCIIKI